MTTPHEQYIPFLQYCLVIWVQNSDKIVNKNIPPSKNFLVRTLVFGTPFRFVVKLNFVMICYGQNGANPGLLGLKLPGITAQAKQIFSKAERTLTAIRSKMKEE